MTPRPETLGALRRSAWSEERIANRTVKDEVRANLLERLRTGSPLFPGIHGYDDTVIPQIINALLSRHNFILLGLRGQAKSRILRSLAEFLDETAPVVAGCEINDNPYRPICRACRERVRQCGGATQIAWLPRELRYVEKLATPDVTIADLIGDLDPIKAARSGHDLSDELTIHYGLLPRANRGIFAVNELPDLAGKIQVGLFNIMQEGDIQIKGYPVRLPLDVLLVFTANPEDYTARGKIITPLKDRIGSEIRTHYPPTIEEAATITSQEAWLARDGSLRIEIPDFVRDLVEEIAFLAREDKRVDRRSGVSQRLSISCLECVVSSAEQRAVRTRQTTEVARVFDVYTSLPTITGKLELEYEGELRGAENVAAELVRAAVGRAFDRRMGEAPLQHVVQWFEQGGELKLAAAATPADLLKQLRRIEGLYPELSRLGVNGTSAAPMIVAAAEFVLEGLWAHKRIHRSEERGFYAERRVEPPRTADRREPSGRPPRRSLN
jgi:magnesium chelatase subunit I